MELKNLRVVGTYWDLRITWTLVRREHLEGFGFAFGYGAGMGRPELGKMAAASVFASEQKDLLGHGGDENLGIFFWRVCENPFCYGNTKGGGDESK